MNIAYPVGLVPQADGSLLVRFPDVPEALTDGETQAEALTEAVGCLVVALGGYIHEGQDILKPWRPKRGQPVVSPPPLTVAKLALDSVIAFIHQVYGSDK